MAIPKGGGMEVDLKEDKVRFWQYCFCLGSQAIQASIFRQSAFTEFH